jgi:N-acetyl-gamma-glutamyl-phosphate reductase
MSTKVFIDGEAGTTGLLIRQRLSGRRDLELLSLDPDRRKDPAARADRLNSADVAILCLPDEAAREAAALVENSSVRIIDASTAHRTAEGWTYGFPELAPGHRDVVAGARRVSNPGCYATGAVALLRPLVDAGLVPATWPVVINAVSGYSGGGKAMIEEYEDEKAPSFTRSAYRLYALGLNHKHVPEIAAHARLGRRPLFAPAVGRYARGMIVEAPLVLDALPGSPGLGALHEALRERYAGERFVRVADPKEAAALKTLDPEALNGTNELRLFVFGNEGESQALLVALLDNLGKGASGAAVQSLNLMTGAPEDAGL